MLQTLLVPGITPLENKDELNHWENRPISGGVWIEAIGFGNINRNTETTRNRTIKKKSKRVRTAFTTDQIRSLEKTFLQNKYINSENRRELSKRLNIGEKCIKIWFQNRRMKEKRASSESSDTSSETFGRETTSPLLVQTESDALYQNHQNCQTNSNETRPYYQPITFQAFNEKPEAMNEPTNFPQNEYNNGFPFYTETNPYMQFYPNVETDVNNTYVYQNQYQYGHEMYNWCQDNTDYNHFYQ